MAKKPEAEPAAAEAPAARPTSRKKLIIVITAAVVLVGGAVGGWFMIGGKHNGGEAQANVEDARKKAARLGPPVFLPLESFVVNLQPQTSAQFLQVDITLRVADARVVDEVKALMPEVRDRVLSLLGTRNSEELTVPGGRDKLAEAVRAEITRVIDPDAVKPELPKLTKEPAEGEETALPEASEDEQADTGLSEEETPDPKIRSVLFTSFIIQ